MSRVLVWDDEQAAVARMALSMLSYGTDHAAERGRIAVMLAGLAPPGPADDFLHMDKPARMTAVVSAALPETVGSREFVSAVREGTERRLAELLGPADCSVVAAVA